MENLAQVLYWALRPKVNQIQIKKWNLDLILNLDRIWFNLFQTWFKLMITFMISMGLHEFYIRVLQLCDRYARVN
jgi:hypothetical protein